MWYNEFCIFQSGVTALNDACYNAKSETVSLLLEAGAKTDIQDTVASNFD